MARDEQQPLIPPIGDEPGPARPLAADQAEAIARAAVRRARSASPRRAFPLQLVASVALAVIAIGGALAAVTTFLVQDETGAEADTRGHTATPKPRARPGVEREAPRAPRPAATRPPALEEPKPTDTPASTQAPDTPRAHGTGGGGTGGDMLQRANRLRAAGRYAQAERAYTRVARTTGRQGTGAAYAATIAAAELRLEHTNDPAGALRLFRRALRMQPRGALSAAAQYGIAQSQRVLGRPEAEARALAELIEAHPDHLLRTRAEARLKVLQTNRP